MWSCRKGNCYRGVNILLLDMNTASGLGNSLRDVLEGAVCRHGRMVPKHMSLDGLPSMEEGVSRVIGDFRPSVAIVVSPLQARRTSFLLVKNLATEHPSLPLIAAMSEENPDELIEILKLGIVDFIVPPFTITDIVPRIWRILKQSVEERNIAHILKKRVGLRQLVGRSPAFLKVVNAIPLIAKCDASVLISGETGTGKELCARAIHYLGPRADKPFVPVNCGAIPAELVENELFGHARGAYTGADSQQSGLIAEAEGGTLFLDEIDCLPPASQVKLLRFIQDREYRTLGSPRARRADIRIISATNRDVEKAVNEASLRRDLFYRLSIIPLRLPLLNERREDIPLLANHFLSSFTACTDKQDMKLSDEALQKLMAYEWPGNVRELENIIERTVVFSSRTIIHGGDIPLPQSDRETCRESFREAKCRVIEAFEKNYIHDLLITHRGNISRAAKAADKNRRAFWQLMKKHNIDAGNYIQYGQ